MRKSEKNIYPDGGQQHRFQRRLLFYQTNNWGGLFGSIFAYSMFG
jgi:hypothetical protein